MKKSINNKAKGFTIVELLVVIVVIGILAAITVVSYSGISDKARAAQAKTAAYAMRDAADQYFAEKSWYPFTASELQTYVSLPTGVAFQGSNTALTKDSNIPGSVKIKYQTCNGTAGGPTATGATNLGYKITYFEGSEQVISAGTTTNCATSF